MPTSLKIAAFSALIVLICILAYWPGLSGPLFFDDRPAIASNELIKIDGRTFDEWRAAALSSDSGPLKRPLAMLSFTVNHVLSSQVDAFDIKLVNLILHLSIGLVLYFLFRVVIDHTSVVQSDDLSRLVAVIAVALWLLHPLHVSTVLYAVQRMTQLSALGVVTGLLVFVRYRSVWAKRGSTTGEMMAAILWLLLLTLVSALSKENGVLLLWLVVCLEVCIFGGLWNGRVYRVLRNSGWALMILPFIALLLLPMLMSDVLVSAYAGREFSLQERALTQGRVLWHYLGWLTIPNISFMGFHHDDIAISSGWLSPITSVIAIFGWIVLLALSFFLKKRFPLLLLAVLFYLVGHSMESSIWPLEMVYEHRNYLPSVFICLLLAAIIVVSVARIRKVSVWYPVLGSLSVVCLLLAIRVQSWSSELALSQAGVENHPESSRSNYAYANALLRDARRAEQSGLSEQEQTESMLLARHFFERMYQTNNRDVAAVALLYYLDSQYFPELRDSVDWWVHLEALLAERKLQPSDWNALGTLFEMLSNDQQLQEADRVLALLDALSSRYPNSHRLSLFRYQYLSARDPEHPDLLPILLQAQQQNPRAHWIYQALIAESFSRGDVARMYAHTKAWMKYDEQRRDINRIKSLFFTTDSARIEADE